MQIKLLSLKLKNFKGLKDFIFDPNGSNASIYGDNGKGKTTVVDAFLWLLFDKDSKGRKDFEIKTFDPENPGDTLHHLDHEVEAVLNIDGKRTVLRKQLVEKWTRKRGQASEEFAGHETNCWVDEVPVKKGEFASKISSLVNEDIFKLITNPLAFNSLPWQDRRKLLTEICGSVSDEEVILSSNEIIELIKIVGGRPVDDYKKIISERMKRLNDDIKQISPRIDELNNQLPNEVVDYSETEEDIKNYKSELEDVETELATVAKFADEIRKKQQEFFKLQQDMEKCKKILDADANSGNKKLQEEKSRLEIERYTANLTITNNGNLIKSNQDTIEKVKSEIESLRKKWGEINAETLPENSLTCPTCGQDMPEDKVSSIISSFEENKKSRKADVNAKGLKLSNSLKSLEEDIGWLQKEVEEGNASLIVMDNRLADINIALSENTEVLADYSADTEYNLLKTSHDALQKELDKPVENKSAELIQKKQIIASRIEACNKILNNRTLAENNKKRIEELKRQERDLSGQITELERQKYMIEQFTRAKVNMVSESINQRFKHVRFKLFDEQINGGISDCCETMINTNGAWVPCSTNGNTAGCINAGIDIINILCKYYGVNVPFFIDGRESVNEIIDTDSQVINLVVSKDKDLRVEV